MKKRYLDLAFILTLSSVCFVLNWDKEVYKAFISGLLIGGLFVLRFVRGGDDAGEKK